MRRSQPPTSPARSQPTRTSGGRSCSAPTRSNRRRAWQRPSSSRPGRRGGRRCCIVGACTRSRGELVITYVVPLRCESCPAGAHDELVAYLRSLTVRRGREVTVIRGRRVRGDSLRGASSSVRARRPAHRTRPRRRELREREGRGRDDGDQGRRDRARAILADDDVRYTIASLGAVVRALDGADLVVPQNVFPRDGQPWHVRWDGARSLLNRAIGSDPPGTLAIRRSAFLRAGGYDGNVLFENLELMRTIAATGGRVVVRRDLAVLRLPPTTRRFLEQRVRQAYDEFARPARLVASLAIGTGGGRRHDAFPVGARHPRGRRDRRRGVRSSTRRRHGDVPRVDVGLRSPVAR